MDKRSRERHQQHNLIPVPEVHIFNVTPIHPDYRLHQCIDCPWRGWVHPFTEEAA